MPSPRILILRAPGTNCDLETTFAFERAGGKCESVHVNRLLAEPKLLANFQVLCFPGGFSYGDDIAAGRILGNQLRQRLAEHCQEFKGAGKLILGICNGFQILIKSGVLLPADAEGERATLTWNESGRFEDRWVELATAGSTSVFFAGIERLYLPVAHAEGKFITRTPAILGELESRRQIVLRYVSADGGAAAYPANPNGSPGHVAGICDESGRVCGLMPHPERHIDPTQHPRWTRGPLAEVGDGLRVFQNAVNFFR